MKKNPLRDTRYDHLANTTSVSKIGIDSGVAKNDSVEQGAWLKVSNDKEDSMSNPNNKDHYDKLENNQSLNLSHPNYDRNISKLKFGLKSLFRK